MGVQDGKLREGIGLFRAQSVGGARMSLDFY